MTLREIYEKVRLVSSPCALQHIREAKTEGELRWYAHIADANMQRRQKVLLNLEKEYTCSIECDNFPWHLVPHEQTIDLPLRAYYEEVMSMPFSDIVEHYLKAHTEEERDFYSKTMETAIQQPEQEAEYVSLMLKEALKDVKNGRTIPAEQVFAELKAQFSDETREREIKLKTLAAILENPPENERYYTLEEVEEYLNQVLEETDTSPL